jgi:hypothetical protein
MKRLLNVTLLATLVVCAAIGAARPAAAQTVTTGILGGTIEDQQGGRLPGVTVVAVHTTTGTTYQAVTQADGRFSILNVRVGTYTVKASLSGFKDSELKDVVVSLGEERTLLFKLELASVSAEITVTADATLGKRLERGQGVAADDLSFDYGHRPDQHLFQSDGRQRGHADCVSSGTEPALQQPPD